MQEYPSTDELSQIMKVMNSPAGRQLIELFRNDRSPEMKQAMEQAAEGDYSAAKEKISKVLSTPEANALLKQLRGK